MLPLTAVAPYSPEPFFAKTLSSLMNSGLIEDVIIVSEKPVDFKIHRSRLLVTGPLSSQETLIRILHDIRTDYLLFVAQGRYISVEPGALEKILKVAGTTQAGLIYTDFYDVTRGNRVAHSLNDYQPGSVRDDFDLGAVMVFSVSALRKAVTTYGPIPPVKHAGLYDLRLKVSIDHPVYHLGECLYSVFRTNKPTVGEGIFAYVDPRHADRQREMETVFTDYLNQTGAYLSPHRLKTVEHTTHPFPVEASVIIPVRNRKKTVADAVQSALSQETDFPFNIITVDNHSNDGTTAILSRLAGEYTALKHIIPERTDLAIGGCWNEALYSEACGSYAVQLDSDDLYGGTHTLQRIVDMLRQGNYAMVIGSYTIVNFDLIEIPPGLIDHREWTDENGHNNALRVNGLGAPRAFDTQVIRRIGFLNVSYGEDYAAALRICREYRIGRIYESLYLCRRWSDNTDASLSVEEANRNDAFKDKIRSDEIKARKAVNGKA
ncbi:MAG: putative glycosyltransferase EpsE [Syntrophorhabdus sp. PtaU1.Bin050]|nr:MAG: putative glycosyltransferase EpsE [Syntrophorhabdus sp. PtaU1.Bin050]